MERFDYVIVGAGFAGCVCAERLAQAGCSVLLIDRRSHIGGNAYDEYDEAGILVHRYGAHVFHTNSEAVYQYLSQFTAWRPYEHRVLSFVNGRLLPVPINRRTLRAFDGDEIRAREAMYAPYTRKQWGEWADALAPTVLARVKVRESDDDRYFTDRFQAMPVEGFTALLRRMTAHPNIAVRLKADYRELAQAWSDPGSLSEARRFHVQRPFVIYTGPIDEFFGHRLGRLPYRSARFVFRTLPHDRCQSVGVVNYPSEAYAFTRVAEFKHLTGQGHPKTTIAYEYPCAGGDPYWPVPTIASKTLYQQYAALAAQTPRVAFVGRLGTFQYYDIDQVVAQALTLTTSILKQREEGVCLDRD